MLLLLLLLAALLLRCALPWHQTHVVLLHNARAMYRRLFLLSLSLLLLLPPCVA
jgi:hypothetical protein